MSSIRRSIDLIEAVFDEPEQSTVVFVYGSLKRGFHNHHIIERAKFVGEGRTAPHYDLLDLGAFPAAIHGKHSVIGELYEVDATIMADLDRLESNGDYYQRELIPITSMASQHAAWCYLYLHDDGFDPLIEPVGGTVTWNNPD